MLCFRRLLRVWIWKLKHSVSRLRSESAAWQMAPLRHSVQATHRCGADSIYSAGICSHQGQWHGDFPFCFGKTGGVLCVFMFVSWNYENWCYMFGFLWGNRSNWRWSPVNKPHSICFRYETRTLKFVEMFVKAIFFSNNIYFYILC